MIRAGMNNNQKTMKVMCLQIGKCLLAKHLLMMYYLHLNNHLLANLALSHQTRCQRMPFLPGRECTPTRQTRQYTARLYPASVDWVDLDNLSSCLRSL